jgi:hypothetical protein
MKSKYHREISIKALAPLFSEDALDNIVRANIRQDKIKNQFVHDFIHFDSSAFEEGFSYIRDQERIISDSISNDAHLRARQALGRLLHSWQDFYSHSNYVHLWISKTESAEAEKIVFDDLEIMDSPELISGKNYGIIEFVALLPVLSKFIKPLMPEDSHAKMNLDDPGASPYFGYAYMAALKRSEYETSRIVNSLLKNNIKTEYITRFLGKILEEDKV